MYQNFCALIMISTSTAANHFNAPISKASVTLSGDQPGPTIVATQSSKLNCSDDAPSISIQDQQYRVLPINHTHSSFKISRVEYWNNVCPTTLTNSTAIDDSSSSHVFEYASGVQTHALQHIPLPPQLINPYNCTTNFITNLLVRVLLLVPPPSSTMWHKIPPISGSPTLVVPLEPATHPSSSAFLNFQLHI